MPGVGPSLSQLQENLGGLNLGDVFSGKDNSSGMGQNDSGVFSPWLPDVIDSFQPPHPLDQSSSSDKFGLNR